MSIKPSLPRHSVENLGNGIQVTIPSKKNFFKILWFCFWLIVWGYMVGGIIYVLGLMVGGALGWLGNGSSEPGSNSVLIITIICLLPFLFMLLGMGGIAIYSFIWQIIGKEIIQVNLETLIITKQVFRWKQSKEHSAQAVKDLRVNTQQLSSFAPVRSVQKLLGQDGMITFDYGAKTVRFGLEIDEAEAKQIIQILRQNLPLTNAG